MSFFSYDSIEIAGIASAVPRKIVEVDSFICDFGAETVNKFKRNTGVQQYRKAADGQTASDLGVAAVENILSKTGLDRMKIGLLAFVSLSPDYLRPATACVLQHRLGLSKDCAAFDIGMGCSGFAYGLQIAASMMQQSDVEWALLLASDAANRLMYPKDKSTVMLIGDAGTAVLLHKSTGHFLHGLLGTDGSYYDAAIVPAGGFRHRNVGREPFTTWDGTVRTNYHYSMNGVDIFSYSMSDIPIAFQDFFRRVGTEANEYDSVVLHQANKMIVDRLAKKIGAPAEKVPISLDRYGNTSSAAIPLTLCDAYAGQKGVRRILACGFGTGLSYGVIDFSVDAGVIFPVIETDECYEDGLIQ